jgi:hypothetical protein
MRRCFLGASNGPAGTRRRLRTGTINAEGSAKQDSFPTNGSWPEMGFGRLVGGTFDHPSHSPVKKEGWPAGPPAP